MRTAPKAAATDKDGSAALALIDAATVMTLAVTTAEGPWTAPVYYVYRPADNGFYFFSSPESRHITAGLEVDACGAAIFQPADTWKKICGLQMRGKLAPATAMSGVRALSLYLKKFPFSRDLLPAGKASLDVFRDRLGVRLYLFRANYIEWTDNRIRFGYRCCLAL
jgi:uncharacterized protein YhbP (UPF0306 family)